MPQSVSLQSHSKCREAMDRAVASANGVRVKFAGPKAKAQAQSFRFNCYALRKRQAKYNHDVFQPADPLYGRTEWDRLSFVLETVGEETHLLIGEIVADAGNIEEL